MKITLLFFHQFPMASDNNFKNFFHTFWYLKSPRTLNILWEYFHIKIKNSFNACRYSMVGIFHILSNSWPPGQTSECYSLNHGSRVFHLLAVWLWTNGFPSPGSVSPFTIWHQHWLSQGADLNFFRDSDCFRDWWILDFPYPYSSHMTSCECEQTTS